MRIAIGGMSHETNTFTRFTTPWEAFTVTEGDAMLHSEEALADSSLLGIIRTLKANDVQMVPTLFARTLPSGPIEWEAYEDLKGRLLEGIRRGGKLDAVVLAMHGSMYVDTLGDADGDLLAAIRDLVGSQVPIVCALDMHGTITRQIIENANALVGFRTAPHIDTVATGDKAAELALLALRENLELVTTWASIPMLVSGEQSETKASPMTEIIGELVHLPAAGEILSSSVFLGFPWADVPYNCVSSIVVTARESLVAGEVEAKRLAQLIWDRRNEFIFTTEAHDLEECLAIAAREPVGPIIIADGGDNPTAGAAENLTNALDVMIRLQVQNALFAVVADKQAYDQCATAGIGNCVSLRLGRVNPTTEPPLPLEIEVHVKALGRAKGIPSAVIGVAGIDVIVTAARTDVYDPQLLADLDLDPLAYQVIVVKSGYLSPTFAALTARPMLALTPGDTNLVLESIPYQVTPRPIHPLDRDFHWRPEVR